MGYKDIILNILKDSGEAMNIYQIQDCILQRFNIKLSRKDIGTYLNRLIEKDLVYSKNNSDLIHYLYINPLMKLIFKTFDKAPFPDFFFENFNNKATMLFLKEISQEYLKPYFSTIKQDIEGFYYGK